MLSVYRRGLIVQPDWSVDSFKQQRQAGIYEEGENEGLPVFIPYWRGAFRRIRDWFRWARNSDS